MSWDRTRDHVRHLPPEDGLPEDGVWGRVYIEDDANGGWTWANRSGGHWWQTGHHVLNAERVREWRRADLRSQLAESLRLEAAE